MKLYLYFLLAFIIFATPSFAYAQAGVFGQSVERIPSIQFERNNQYMADILSLQNQIALFKKIIDRQKELNEMAGYLTELGMPFVPPAPEFEICEKLPGNDLCAEFYPDLYEDYTPSIASSSSVAAVLQPLPQIQSIPFTQNINELDLISQQALSEAEFYWSDISCLNVKCKATVVPNIQGSMARYTVRVGDELPNGLTIDDISSQGVKTRNGAEIVLLNPAPVIGNIDNQATL